jgi:hypothetical protein
MIALLKKIFPPVLRYPMKMPHKWVETGKS